MTYKQLQDAALEECGYNAAMTTSTPRQRMRRRINDWYRRILARPGMTRLVRDAFSYTFDTVASTHTYGLPLALGRVNALMDQDNEIRLQLKTLSWVREQDPALTSEGTPEVYVLKGWFPVHTQPSAAATVVCESTSASDTNTVRLEYLTTGGVRKLATATMTGTSYVTLGTDIREITAWSIDVEASGTLSLYEFGTANTYGAIQPNSTHSRYLHIQLWPTPSAATTYVLDYTREVADLEYDTDEPLIPPDFHHLLWRGAVVDEWLLKDDSRYEAVRRDLELELKSLTAWIWNQDDYVPTPVDGRPRGSRLGPWFEAGT